MNSSKLKKNLVSIYIIFSLVTAGFIGLLVFEGIVDEGGVEAAPTTRIVDQKGGGDHTTIKAAISASTYGDIINVWAGHYKEQLSMSKGIKIIGNGTANTTIDGNCLGTTITISWVGPTLLKGFKINNSKSNKNQVGIKILNSNGVRIKDCILENHASAIFLDFSDQSTFENNYFNNSYNGVFVDHWSDRNYIRNNIFRNCSRGVSINDYSIKNEIINNSMSDGGIGINLYDKSNENIFMFNNCSDNSYGFKSDKDSEKNRIENNTFSLNSLGGIYIAYGPETLISNNTLIENEDDAIYITRSTNCRIINNTCISNDGKAIAILNLGKQQIIENNTCIDNSFTHIFIWRQDQSYISNNTCIGGSTGIELKETDDTEVINNTCVSNRLYGITVGSGHRNHVFNNRINASDRWGIMVNKDFTNDPKPTYNIVENNTVNFSKWSGIAVAYGEFNVIKNNTCSNNREGLWIYRASSNRFENNSLTFNNEYGIKVYSPDKGDVPKNNLVLNNTCADNDHGIFLENAVNNTITINNCTKNNHGITLYDDSSNNLLTENHCHYNNISGINLTTSRNNLIFNDLCERNGIGIILQNADYNKISNCTINQNPIGINCSEWTESFHIINSTISSSAKYDIQLTDDSHAFAVNCSMSWSNMNYIDDESNLTVQWYLQVNVTDNKSSPIDKASVLVRNAYGNQEFIGATDITGKCRWIECSEYVENITGRVKTLTPHNITVAKTPYEEGYAYPKPNMTTNRAITIVLNPDITPPVPPTGLSFDGRGISYLNMSWLESISHDVCGYKVYMNQTGSSTKFDLITSTTNCYFKVTKLAEDTLYFFKIQSFDDVPLESTFISGSNTTLDMTPPEPPTNLEISSFGGDYINLSWAPSTSHDVLKYNVLVNESDSSVVFQFLASTTNCFYNHTGLSEKTTYYYKVQAYDDVSLPSVASVVQSITTLDLTAPKIPIGLNASALSGSQIVLTWTQNSDSDINGYEIYMNGSNSRPEAEFQLITTVPAVASQYTISDLFEEVTYYFSVKAFDEVPNYSGFSNLASATTLDETMPKPPEGVRVSNPTSYSLMISWDKNLEDDIVGYNVYRSNAFDGIYSMINSELVTETKFIDTTLNMMTAYYYKITAIDDVELESEFSVIIFGKTLLAQLAPEINNTLNDFEMFEDTIDTTSINLFHWFKDINNDKLSFRYDKNEKISVEIYEDGTVKLTPKKDWSGKVTLTFYANDGVHEISDKVQITIIQVNDVPTNPIILLSEDKYYEGKTQLAVGDASDVDDLYGDDLLFKWFRNSTELIRFGQKIDLSLPAGIHTITLNVTDNEGAGCETSVEIEIFKLIDEPTDVNDTELDSDNDNYPDDMDAFPNNASEWEDTDGDNFGDNIDEYPNDPAKWRSEDEQLQDEQQPEKKDKNVKDSSGIMIGAVVVIIIVIIILISLFLFKRKKKEEIDSEIPSIVGQEIQIRSQTRISQPQQVIQQPLPVQPPQQTQAAPTLQTQPIQIAQQPQLVTPARQIQLLPMAKTTQSQQNLCTSCGQQLTFIPQNNRYYCYQCKRYE